MNVILKLDNRTYALRWFLLISQMSADSFFADFCKNQRYPWECIFLDCCKFSWIDHRGISLEVCPCLEISAKELIQKLQLPVVKVMDAP